VKQFPWLLSSHAWQSNMQQLTEKLAKLFCMATRFVSRRNASAWVQSTGRATHQADNIHGRFLKRAGQAGDIPITATGLSSIKSGHLIQNVDVFSSAGEKAQRQLGPSKPISSNPKKVTNMNGYAARPRWSMTGKQCLRTSKVRAAAVR